MKKILVLYYTQSGQLKEIADNICKPLLSDNEISIEFQPIKLKNDFPFPWNKKDFFNVFPESFLQEPIEIESINFQNSNYDLIILCYQVWYLSPSIPINSFLCSEQAKNIFHNTPVITVIGCRNMWVMAQEKVKNQLNNLKANLVGNITLLDRHINHISVITIVQWMFTGKKDKYLGIFPKPGVSDYDIQNSVKFGHIIQNKLKENNLNSLHEELLNYNAVLTKPFLIQMDKTANKMFNKWANIVKNSKNRPFMLKLFNYYLLFAIWIISPIVYCIFAVLYPIRYKKIKKQLNYYKGIKLK